MISRSTLGSQFAGLAPDGDDVAASLLRAALRSRLVDKDATVRLGRYEVGKRLGEGGMGVVYEGRDPDLDRRVAIKVLRERSDEAEGVLQREAQLLAQFTHEHSVTVFDIGADAGGGHVWVAMELVDGVNMRHWLRDARPSRTEILAAFGAASSALAAMHRAGLSHGDFKPENVLVGPNVLKVADFGLARLVGDASTASGHGSGAVSGPSARTVGGGTPGYLPPERLDGGKASPLADQFAFCVAVFEALHGELPYADEAATRAGAVASTDRRDRLDRVLRRGLRPDPKLRFASMDQLHAAMLRAGGRRGATLVAAVGVLGAIGGSVAWASRPEPAPAVARVEPADERSVEIDLTPFDAAAAPIQEHINAARYAEAKAAVPELFAVAERLGSDRATAMALRIQGTIAQRTGDYEAAISDFVRARDMAWAADAASLATASAISLSHVYSEQLSDHERALGELDMASALLKRREIDPNEDLAFVRARGTATLRSGDRVGALVHFERVVELLGKQPADPIARAAALFYVAEAAWPTNPARARAAADESLPVLVDKLGADHPFVAAFHGIAGKVADSEGRLADARAAFAEALRIYVTADNEPLMIAETERLLASVATKAGDVDDAHAHLSSGMARLGSGESNSHAAFELGFGQVAFARGEHEQAERHYRNCLRIFEANEGPDHRDLVPAHVLLAQLYAGDGRAAEAVTHAQRALAIIGEAPHDRRAEAAAIVARAGAPAPAG